MKTLLLSIGLGMVLLNGLSTASAQIRDNESSVTALAIQCAVSSGYSAQDYEEYCRSLAKTIGMLSSAQQTRIFGYLPMPGGAAGAETAATVETAPVQTATTSTTTAPEAANAATTAAAKVVDSPTPSQPATEAAKTVGTTSPSTTTNSTSSGGSSSNGNSLLDFIIQLLRGTTSSATQKL